MIMETIQRETSWNLIDIGCGQQGRILVSIADKIREGYGFDYNLKSNRKIKDNIYLSNDDFLTCEKTFDVIIMLAVLEHLPYPDSVGRMLSAINERLNAGGVVILTTPDKKARWLLEFLAYRLHIINEEEIRDHKHYFDKAELSEVLKSAGYQSVQVKPFQFGLNNYAVCKK
jgi:2-polyprenyl-3-methyl-5-hydroxy-6-metoxy-1,4-benzoquinol methylase